MTWYYNLVIGLGGIIIGLLAFADPIGSKILYFKALKSLFFKIPFFILGSAMILWATIMKDIDNEDKEDRANNTYTQHLEKMEKNYQKEQKLSDSIYAKRIQETIDSSYLKSIKASNEALAKFNLQLVDSLHTVASSIKIKGNYAQLDIDAVKEGKSPIYIDSFEGLKELNYRIISANATSYNIRINTYIINEKDPTNPVIQYFIDPGGYSFLVPDRERTLGFILNPDVLNYDNLLIVFLGKYSREEKGGEIIEFKSALNFNFKENKILNRRPGINHSELKKYLVSMKIPV